MPPVPCATVPHACRTRSGVHTHARLAQSSSDRLTNPSPPSQILMVHGVLHLLGYDHELGEPEYTEMVEAERKLLTRLGWKGDGLIDAASKVDSCDS